jgi:CBS domain-containing protein
MIKAEEIMAKDVITVFPDTEVVQAAKILVEENINGVPVVDEEGKMVGILCQSDLIAQQKTIPLPSLFTLLDGFIPLTSMKKFEKGIQKIAAIKVSDAMTADPVTVSPDTGIGEIANLMVDKNFHSIPVVDEGKLVGIIGKEDILKTLIPKD